jgi:plasmid stabilization system protein ParE
MAFTVEFTKRAETQLSAAYKYVLEHTSPSTASHWLARFKKKVLSLEYFPRRHAVASEARKLGFPYRRFHFGRRAGAFLVYYKLTSLGEHTGTVTITHIRRALRDAPGITDFWE